MIDPDAPQIVARDDAGSGPETITERTQVGEASGDGEGNDQQDHGSDRPVPFARSNDFQHTGKPSKNRLARQHRRLYPTKLLHNARSTVALSVCDGGVNGSADYYTRPLHNLPKGVCLQGRIYHLRRRVPDALRTVIGRSELWRSLRTDSVQIALRRVHFAAAEIEAELEAARAAIGLLIDPYAPRSSSSPSGESSLSLLAEKVAERLAIERAMPEPMTPPIPKSKTLGEVYDLYTADPRHTWCERTRIAYP